MSFIYVHRCTYTHTRANGIQSIPSWRRFQLKSTPRVASVSQPPLPSIPFAFSLSSLVYLSTSLPPSRIPAQNQIRLSPFIAPFFAVSCFGFVSPPPATPSAARYFLFRRLSSFLVSPTFSHEKFTISMKSSARVKLMERRL